MPDATQGSGEWLQQHLQHRLPAIIEMPPREGAPSGHSRGTIAHNGVEGAIITEKLRQRPRQEGREVGQAGRVRPAAVEHLQRRKDCSCMCMCMQCVRCMQNALANIDAVVPLEWKNCGDPKAMHATCSHYELASSGSLDI